MGESFSFQALAGPNSSERTWRNFPIEYMLPVARRLILFQGARGLKISRPRRRYRSRMCGAAMPAATEALSSAPVEVPAAKENVSRVARPVISSSFISRQAGMMPRIPPPSIESR
jgi:hypothetical protein